MKRLLLVSCVALLFVLPTSGYTRELRVTDQEEYCLALNDYYEARGEPIEGRIAVAFVVINRTLSRLYPRTICESVFQSNGKVCAFSWVCNRVPIRDLGAWDESSRFAKEFLKSYKQMQDPTQGAVHYHEYSILPKWALEFDYNIRIGDHVFYPALVAQLE